MKTKNKILLITPVILIIILMLRLTMPLDKEVISSGFVLGKNPGFDLSPGLLNFGKITPDGSASRSITVTNNYDTPTLTTIKASGPIKDYVIVSENNFELQPSESRNVTFNCYPKEASEYKRYSGEITIITKKAESFFNF